MLTPLGLDPARPFPRIQNKSLNFIVELAGTDAFGRMATLAIVQVPRSLPRIIRLPSVGGAIDLIYLSQVIQTYVEQLFTGMEVRGCHQFRVTRNADLFVDDEETEDLMRAVQGELASRRYGDAVRLETRVDCPPHVRDFLLERFELAPEDHYAVDGPVNLNRLMAIHDLVDRRDLKYAPFAPAVPRRLLGRPDLFEAIREKDVLLHHPFQSFAPVIDFLRQAAADPQVLAIKQTLYRTGADSPVVDALVAAARAGKEVTVVIELMARFDEAANIDLATRLQEAGAQVMYGVVGFKTHAKLIMVVRREHDRLRRYCHLGTGNYHPKTTRQYTDYGLFSCDEAIGEDLHELFLQLTSPTRVAQMRKVLQSPVHDARGDARAHAARDRPRPRGAAGTHRGEDERADRAADHPGALRSVDGRREGRSDRARRLLAAARRAGRLRQHHGALDRRPVSRALARLLLRERRRPRGVLRERRLDGAQLLPPDRGRLPGAATPSPPAAVRGP